MAPDPQPYSTLGPTTPEDQRVAFHTLYLWLAGTFLLMLLLQFPAAADFQKFGLYDQGAWLHLVQLVGQGRTPTVDLGYSYGMLPLILSRAWFAVFGINPWAFIAFATVCNLLSALGIAQILHAIYATRRRLVLACCLLPMALMPNPLSLMHPLETLLIIWALAQQVRNRYGLALAFAVAAVFTKPSMGYILGFLLLSFGLLRIFQNARASRAADPPAPASPLKDLLRLVIPPTVTAVALLALSISCVGMRPAVANILPITGAKSYQQMNFGFFHAGREFWLYWGGFSFSGFLNTFCHYFLNPPFFWLLGTLLLFAMGFFVISRMKWWNQHPDDHFVATLALLHAGFIFLLYAWQGSWSYYSYLLVLGLLVSLRGVVRTRVLHLLTALALLGIAQPYGDAFIRWLGMTPSSQLGGLFTYKSELPDALQVREVAREHHAIFLTNGSLNLIWPEAQTPAAWFLSPGIPTGPEILALQNQLDHAEMIILCNDYDQSQETWFWPQLAPQRAQFSKEPFWQSKHFSAYLRKP